MESRFRHGFNLRLASLIVQEVRLHEPDWSGGSPERPIPYEAKSAYRMLPLNSFDALAIALQQDPGAYALLLGSGLSRAAGIPTGWEITLEL